MRSLVATVVLFASVNLLGQDLKWETNYEAALKRARAEKKLIFVDVWAAWCGPCKRLQTDVFPSDEGKKALAKYVPLSLKTRTEDNKPTDNVWAEKKFALEAYPTMFVLNPDAQQIGDKVIGFLPPKEFASWLNKISK